jgi:hypothetical protein
MASPTSSPRATSPVGSTFQEQVLNTTILSHQTSPNSVKDKFVSSLGLSLSFSRNNDDDQSVNSARSAKSSSSRHSLGSAAGRSVKSSQHKALGRTNSAEEEVDEDPADMIENINEMLSECRVILDTDTDAPGIR